MRVLAKWNVWKRSVESISIRERRVMLGFRNFMMIFAVAQLMYSLAYSMATSMATSLNASQSSIEPAPIATLPLLIQEALDNNPEILEKQKAREQASARHSQSKSPFLPEFGLEGGVESYKATNESLSNSFGYAFGRYNLYRGGQDRLGLLVSSKEESQTLFEVSKVKARISREISTQYYMLIYFQEAIRIKEEALQLNNVQVKMAEKRAKSGITSRADVLEFELRDATLNSDISLLKQERDEAVREISRLFNRSDGTAPVIAKGELPHEHVKVSVADVLALALRERLDLKENEKDQEVAGLTYKATRSEWLPKIDAEVTYGTLDRRSRILDQTPSWDAQLKISIPLFSGFNSYYGRTAQAKEVEKLNARAVKFHREIKTQVENAYARIKAIEARVDLEEKNNERAQHYYNITLSEYQRGVKNSPDLAGAAERLFDSKLRSLEFKKDFFIAKIRLAEAGGVDAL